MKFLTKKKSEMTLVLHPNNQYTFANTQNSEHHVSGWIVCSKGALNATKNVH